MKAWIALAALALALPATAQNPRVWLDTEFGPIFLELDQQKAPKTTQHFLEVVDSGYYDNHVFHRTIKDQFAQAGRWTASGSYVAEGSAVESERENGLLHEIGTIAIALPSQGGDPLFDNGSTDFFINLARQTNFDGVYTVFGRVVYGLSVVEAIADQPTDLYRHSQPNEPPVQIDFKPWNPVTIRRAVQIEGEFPAMQLHTASWYDPANPYRGVSLEVTSNSGGPLVVVYWYDYFEGRQVWMNGAASFEYGDGEITVPLQITEGGQFGAAFDPELVVRDTDFGTMTVRFTGCNSASFDYDVAFGTGTLDLERLTQLAGTNCPTQ